jgi:hypothetical protein
VRRCIRGQHAHLLAELHGRTATQRGGHGFQAGQQPVRVPDGEHRPVDDDARERDHAVRRRQHGTLRRQREVDATVPRRPRVLRGQERALDPDRRGDGRADEAPVGRRHRPRAWPPGPCARRQQDDDRGPGSEVPGDGGRGHDPKRPAPGPTAVDEPTTLGTPCDIAGLWAARPGPAIR